MEDVGRVSPTSAESNANAVVKDDSSLGHDPRPPLKDSTNKSVQHDRASHLHGGRKRPSHLLRGHKPSKRKSSSSHTMSHHSHEELQRASTTSYPPDSAVVVGEAGVGGGKPPSSGHHDALSDAEATSGQGVEELLEQAKSRSSSISPKNAAEDVEQAGGFAPPLPEGGVLRWQAFSYSKAVSGQLAPVLEQESSSKDGAKPSLEEKSSAPASPASAGAPSRWHQRRERLDQVARLSEIVSGLLRERRDFVFQIDSVPGLSIHVEEIGRAPAEEDIGRRSGIMLGGNTARHAEGRLPARSAREGSTAAARAEWQRYN